MIKAHSKYNLAHEPTIRQVLISVVILGLLLPFAGVSPAGAVVTDPEDLWTSEDIVQINATISSGMLTVQVTERNPLDDFSFHFIEIFLNTDQDHNTGDARVGGVGGTDYRIECLTSILNMFDLHQLPTEDGGEEQTTSFSDIPGASAFVEGNKLTVKLPVDILGGTTAVDVFAVAHEGGNSYGIVGNGDRCPEAGYLDTSTGEAVVRRPGIPLDITFSDPGGDNQHSGQDLTAARFRTFGDQFQIILTFANLVEPLSLSYNLSGTVIMDSDRNLLTGFMGLGDDIPTWGGDVALVYTINYLSPMLNLSFGAGGGSFLLFGPPTSDGRWLVQENRLIMTGSLSVFDARALYVNGGQKEVERRPTDGRMITSGSTFDKLLTSDIMPEGGSAFDTGMGEILDPLVWDPAITISEDDPEEFGGVSGMDLIRVDMQVVENCLVVKGVLSKWDNTQVGNVFEILLDTDMNTATGEFVSNDQTLGQPAIGADYKVRVYSWDEYTHVGYYADLERPDGVIEPHDAIVFARPSSLGPASFTVTIPLEAVGNPTPDIRLFVTTGAIFAGRYDIAPPYPIIIHITPSCEGDFDHDGDVDGSDLAMFAADFGRTDCNSDCSGDFDGDGDVDGSDLAVFAADFGRTDCP